VEAVQVLRATWIQQFDRDGGQVRWRDKHSGLPPGRLLILNPYDPDARPGSKRGRNWRGYKMECGGPPRHSRSSLLYGSGRRRAEATRRGR